MDWPFKNQAILNGKSPSLMEHVISANCPSCKGLSWNSKGVIRGRTKKRCGQIYKSTRQNKLRLLQTRYHLHVNW